MALRMISREPIGALPSPDRAIQLCLTSMAQEQPSESLACRLEAIAARAKGLAGAIRATVRPTHQTPALQAERAVQQWADDTLAVYLDNSWEPRS